MFFGILDIIIDSTLLLLVSYISHVFFGDKKYIFISIQKTLYIETLYLLNITSAIVILF